MLIGNFCIMAKRLTRSRIKEISSSMVSPLVIGPGKPMSTLPDAGAKKPEIFVTTATAEQESNPESILTPSCDMSNLDIKPKADRKRGNSHIKIEYDASGIETGQPLDTSADETKSPTAKKDKWQPPLWKQQLLNVYEMRRCRDAPVDTMGCDRISDQNAEPKVYRYQVLLGLMLSSQTKDQITSAAMRKLRDHGCNIDNILLTSDKQLGELIYPVGFWKRKVDYIKRTTQILKDKYDGDIPNTIKELCELPGVGPKMAYLVMKSAWNVIDGIGVDTHVHRISNRLGWVKKPTKQPEDTRKALEDWLPRDYWSEINLLLVGFGQQICLPVSPLCVGCLNASICPSAKKVKTSPRPRKNLQVTIDTKPGAYTGHKLATTPEVYLHDNTDTDGSHHGNEETQSNDNAEDAVATEMDNVQMKTESKYFKK